jgi:hypothetical protein
MHPLEYKVVYKDFQNNTHIESVKGHGEYDAEKKAYVKFHDCMLVMSAEVITL